MLVFRAFCFTTVVSVVSQKKLFVKDAKGNDNEYYLFINSVTLIRVLRLSRMIVFCIL